MNHLPIKPMSVNEAWQGKRFKTKRYKEYERSVCLILPKIKVPEGELQLELVFGFSSKLADFDNPVKPFTDCLQKKYGFNDRYIKRCIIDVHNVAKGEEFIKFEIKGLAA